jgi:cytochrome c-type biogenesis protein CcmH
MIFMRSHHTKTVKSFLICLVMTVCIASVIAVEAPPLAENPELEAKVLQVSAELRCLVCQNESIADSHADLAVDLRNQIRAQLEGGKNQKEIISYMVDRYGDFVLYKPPVQSNTLLLWFGPFILLLISIWALLRFIGQKNDTGSRSELSSDELQKARELLSSSKRDTQ